MVHLMVLIEVKWGAGTVLGVAMSSWDLNRCAGLQSAHAVSLLSASLHSCMFDSHKKAFINIAAADDQVSSDSMHGMMPEQHPKSWKPVKQACHSIKEEQHLMSIMRRVNHRVAHKVKLCAGRALRAVQGRAGAAGLCVPALPPG